MVYITNGGNNTNGITPSSACILMLLSLCTSSLKLEIDFLIIHTSLLFLLFHTFDIAAILNITLSFDWFKQIYHVCTEPAILDGIAIISKSLLNIRKRNCWVVSKNTFKLWKMVLNIRSRCITRYILGQGLNPQK